MWNMATVRWTSLCRDLRRVASDCLPLLGGMASSVNYFPPEEISMGNLAPMGNGTLAVLASSQVLLKAERLSENNGQRCAQWMLWQPEKGNGADREMDLGESRYKRRREKRYQRASEKGEARNHTAEKEMRSIKVSARGRV